MDKKGSRSVQSSSKGLSTDKKNQDGVGSKLWPRGSRRREPTGGTYASKNETYRKPNPQRNKGFDKRPRPRGNNHSGPLGGKEIPGLEEADAELGSVFVQGGKKQSLNHLLNFHYQPRDSQWHSGKYVGSKLGHRWLTTFKHKYNKEQFLQANCQFIVKSSGDYKQYMNNPDTLVEWDLVEQVNVQVSDYPSCPICLYPPVAAKMTRCGHIYCWSCILHYLALSDKTWRKCPICYEAIHKNDLKSVVSVSHPLLSVNDMITFKLMKRLRGSLIAYPASETLRDDDQVIFNMSEKGAANIHCKLLLADKNEVMSIIDRERIALEVSLAEDENCPEKCFIQEALELLQVRENEIFNQVEKVLPKFRNEALDLVADEPYAGVNREKHERIDVNTIATGNAVENSNITVEDLDISQSKLPNQQVNKYFYFYQASDGQHIYLHAVNARMLEHSYGSLEMSPLTITGKIVEKEGGSMTEDLRNRLRYLQHLPVTCQFEVAEIRLREPIVSKETLHLFQDQLEMRKKRREKRARDEKRRERRIHEQENRMLMGKFPDAKICLNSIDQFPEVGFDPVNGRTESESTPRSERSLSPVTIGSNTPSSSLSGSLNTENEYAGPSFAKMVSSVKKPNISWPELKSEHKPSPVTRLINVTGAKVTTPNIPRVKKQSDSEPECEDYVPAPQYNRSFSDAIALALEKATISNDEGGQSQSGKKKKKNKQKVLFATTMAYCGK